MVFIGKRVEIVGRHTFNGEKGEIVRKESTSFGEGYVIKLDKEGAECFVYDVRLLKFI